MIDTWRHICDREKKLKFEQTLLFKEIIVVQAEYDLALWVF